MKLESMPKNYHSSEVAEYFSAISLNSIPDVIIAGARRVLLDSLGCGLFGASQIWSKAAVQAVARDGSSGESTVFASTKTNAAPLAAFCNGIATHGYELDDLISESVVHPGAIVVPAVLAAAESNGVKGERVVLGVIAGYEMMHRLGMALGLEPAKRGYHTTGIAGPVAAAMAVGVTLGYSAECLLSAMGLACSTAAGVKSFAGGSGGGMVKRMHAGRSAESGVRMCQLVDCGFDGPRAAIDGRFGLLEVLSGSSAIPGNLSVSLGQQWALEKVWVKVYPVCGLIQAIAQEIEELKRKHSLNSAEITSVRVGVSHHAVRHNSEPLPSDTMAAQYSIPYCVGAALVYDASNPSSYGPDRLLDPLIRAFSDRTVLYVDEEVEAAYPAHFGARVSIELRNGQKFEGYELSPHGTPEHPCTDQELTQKFTRLAKSSCSEAQIQTVIEQISRIERLENLHQLSTALRPTKSAI